jgi:uncharacterized YigZ family protein
MSESSAETFLRIADGPEATTKVKGSRFTGQALSAHSLDEALSRLETIRKRHHDATHHCWAAVWGPPESSEERFDDDGEPSGSAGRPILHHLRGSGACDGLVVVTRWFGGTKLGTGGLVKAYTETAQLALAELTVTEKVERVTVIIKVPYSLYEQVKRLVAAHGGTIDEEDFAVEISLVITFVVDDLPAFEADLAELTAGQIDVVRM